MIRTNEKLGPVAIVVVRLARPSYPIARWEGLAGQTTIVVA